MTTFRRILKTNQSIYLIIAILSFGFISCAPNPENVTEGSEQTASIVSSNDYSLTSDQFNTADMELAKLEKHEFHNAVNTIGIFEVPPQNQASISAYFGGYIKDINLLPGDKIRRGQILFTLENPDYIQVQQDFLVTKSQLAYLKSDYERQKNLVQDNVTSTKNFLKAEANYLASKIRYESLRKRLGLMNINPEVLNENKIQTIIPVLSPISGFVTAINATKGMFLNPSDVAISIIDPDHMHLELILFEKDLATVEVGQQIKFKIQDNDDKQYDANVYLINKSIDPEKRTVTVHGHLADEKNIALFTPGMYVEAEIYTSSTFGMALPEEAVVNIEDKYYVLIKKNSTNDSFELDKMEVQIGRTTEGHVEILNHADFAQDVEILVKGAFNLITD